jgi:hypothetical protein
MDATARRLRGEAKRSANREVPTASRYSAEFREEVSKIARSRRALGVPVVRIAEELGVKSRTLALWLRSAPKRRLRRVEVAPVIEAAPSSASRFSVSVGAMRIEGLELEAIARLARLLS